MEETGIITSINQKVGKYGISLGPDNWYNGLGTCTAKKGDKVKVEFEVNGQWKNIKNISVLTSEPTDFKPSNNLNKSFYVAYAKDLCIAMMSQEKNKSVDEDILMDNAIDLIKKADSIF